MTMHFYTLYFAMYISQVIALSSAECLRSSSPASLINWHDLTGQLIVLVRWLLHCGADDVAFCCKYTYKHNVIILSFMSLSLSVLYGFFKLLKASILMCMDTHNGSVYRPGLNVKVRFTGAVTVNIEIVNCKLTALVGAQYIFVSAGYWLCLE